MVYGMGTALCARRFRPRNGHRLIYEVAHAQYVSVLNATARTDTYPLYPNAQDTPLQGAANGSAVAALCICWYSCHTKCWIQSASIV
jgi:hypothetical protein